jgi:hypothetical protein
MGEFSSLHFLIGTPRRTCPGSNPGIHGGRRVRYSTKEILARYLFILVWGSAPEKNTPSSTSTDTFGTGIVHGLVKGRVPVKLLNFSSVFYYLVFLHSLFCTNCHCKQQAISQIPTFCTIFMSKRKLSCGLLNMNLHF